MVQFLCSRQIRGGRLFIKLKPGSDWDPLFIIINPQINFNATQNGWYWPIPDELRRVEVWGNVGAGEDLGDVEADGAGQGGDKIHRQQVVVTNHLDKDWYRKKDI